MNWLKKYKWPLVIATILLVIAPIFINFLFQKEAIFPIFSVDWSASDALAYFGSIVGGFGTILLGWITIRQTNQINKMALEKENANIKRPFFIIKGVISHETDGNKSWKICQNGYVYHYSKSHHAFIEVINVGDGVANNLIIDPWGIGDPPKKDRPSFCIAPQQGCNVPVYLTASLRHEGTKYITLIYENLLGYSYSQTIELCVNFAPEIVSIDEIETGEVVPEYEEQYCVNIFNIHPQIEHGMNKYDREHGNYKFD